MASLEIPPHAYRRSRQAILILALVAIGSFATGVLRQTAGFAPVVAAVAQPAAARLIALPPATLDLAHAEPILRSSARLTHIAAKPAPAMEPVASAPVSAPVAVDAVATVPAAGPAPASDEAPAA